VFKRTIDILLASVLLALSIPVLATAAVLIKLDSEGPVIFRQARMGRRFRRFQLYKLRTMNLAGEGPAYTLGADPRITRAGRWLRRYKIDELPQLWNVLRGDMSMVGPRPVIPQLAIKFHVDYARLLKVRPGLTDPASLKYCREAEMLERVPDPYRYFMTVVTPAKIRISLAYLEHASVWTDLVIVVRTGLALVFPRMRPRIGIEIPPPKRMAPDVLVLPERRANRGSPMRIQAPHGASPQEVRATVMERSAAHPVQGKTLSL
jgi:lipopolysaccharide/colanic/teichoic acid biosynthesis glycosyltransferase